MDRTRSYLSLFWEIIVLVVHGVFKIFALLERGKTRKRTKPHTQLVPLSPSPSPCLGTLTKNTMTKNLQARRRIPNRSTMCAAGYNKNKKHTLFPTGLLVLLDDAVAEGNEHLVSWLPDGAAFKIHDADLFASRLLKRYFRHCRFKSFTRQLYLYGFVKVENEVGTFRHPQFRRDDINSCLSIDRTNARNHFSSIQDSLKSVRASSLRESGDRRYMRNKLVKEARMGKEDDVQLLKSPASSSTAATSSSSATSSSTSSSSSSSEYYYRSDCASPTSMELATDHLQQEASTSYLFYDDEEDIVLDEKDISTMSETQDDWLARVEKNLMLRVEEPYYNEAASSCYLLEPTPIKEESPNVAIVAPRILSSILGEMVNPPPF